MNETVVTPEPKKSFFKDRPVTLIIAAVLLLLLILAYAVLPLSGLERSFLGNRAGFNRGQFTGNFNPNNLSNGQNFTPGNPPQSGNFDQNGSGTSRTYTGTRQFNANSGLNQVLRILTNILHWTVIGLGILALVGLLLKKRWGIVLAIILAVVAFTSTLPSLFRPSFLAFTIILNIAILVLAVGVVVLTLLPQSRKATAAV